MSSAPLSRLTPATALEPQLGNTKMDDDDLLPQAQRSGVAFPLFLALMFIAIVFWFGFNFVQHNQTTKLEETKRLYREEKQEEAEKAAAVAAENKAIREAEINGRRSNWHRFTAKNNEILTALADLEIENKKRVEAEKLLLDTPTGRFLVKDDRERAVFAGISEKLSGATGQIEQWTITANTFQATASSMQSLANPETDVPASEFSKLLSMADDVSSLEREVRAANQYLSGLIEKGSGSSKTATAPLPETDSPGSLRDRLDSAEADRLAANAAERQRELEELRSESEMKIREMLKAQEAMRLKKEEELLRIQLDLEMKETDSRLEAARLAAAKKAEALEKAKVEALEDKALQTDLDQVKIQLAPFISKARNTFEMGFIRPADESQPVSLSALTAFGALENSTLGIGRLQEAASFLTAKGGRPMGSFSIDLFDKTSAQESQRLLRTHAAAMVRAGLLAP